MPQSKSAPRMHALLERVFDTCFHEEQEVLAGDCRCRVPAETIDTGRWQVKPEALESNRQKTGDSSLLTGWAGFGAIDALQRASGCELGESGLQ